MRYKVKFQLVYHGEIEIEATCDDEAHDLVEDMDATELPTVSNPHVETTDVDCMDKETCVKCGKLGRADVIKHTGGTCRHCTA